MSLPKDVVPDPGEAARRRHADPLLGSLVAAAHRASDATCPDAEQLALYVEGELAANERALVTTHLPTCERCRDVVAAYERASAGAPERGGRVAAPAGAAAGSDGAGLGPWFMGWRWLLPAASVAAVAIVAVWLGRAPAEGPRQAEVASAPDAAAKAGATAGPTMMDRAAPADGLAGGVTAPSSPPAAPPAPAESTARSASAAQPTPGAVAPAGAAATARANRAEADQGPATASADASRQASQGLTGSAVGSREAGGVDATGGSRPTGRGLGVGGGSGSAAGTAAGGPERALADARGSLPADAREARREAQAAASPAPDAAGNRARAASEDVVEGRPVAELARRATVPAAPAAAPATTAAKAAIAEDASIVWRLRGEVVERLRDGRWQGVPTPRGIAVTAVAGPGPSVCWAIGPSSVLRTTDGVAWMRVTAPSTEPLTGITATDASTAIVTTASGARFATADGGATWRRL